MNHGIFLIYFMLVLALGCTVGYLLALLRVRPWRALAQLLFFLMTSVALLACALLLMLFLKDQFQFSYVASYSKQSLPLYYKISALWAGQEGTFLLWFTLSALLGCAVIVREQQDAVAHRVMLVLAGQQILLGYLLIASNPFKLGALVTDGRGLNPLLQNFWMVIHPPVMFLGYAAMALPFAYAVAGLWQGQAEQWGRRSLSWTAFAALSMGAGIFLGGYWAYVTLGWGGFWGWDPVENASLIPWLLSVMLLHGQLLQYRRARLIFLNPLLSILGYVSVLYATFLTRTGILSKFSVHSFHSSDLTVGMLLFIGAALLPASLLYGYRLWQRAAPKAQPLATWEICTYAFLVLLTISSLFILFGTSWPIISGLFGNAASLQPPFYNLTHLPIGTLLCLVLVLFVFYHYRPQLPWWSLLAGALLALAVTVWLVGWQGLGWQYAPFMALALGATLLLAVLGLRHARLQIWHWRSMGAHLGMGLLMLGILFTGLFSVTQKARLREGESAKLFGHHITYQGIAKGAQWSHLKLLIDQHEKIKLAFCLSMGTRVMSTPSLLITPWADLYFAARLHPLSARLVMHKGEHKVFPEVGLGLRFNRFVIKGHHQGGGSVGAHLTIRYHEQTYEPTLQYNLAQRGAVPYQVPGTFLIISLERIIADSGAIRLLVQDLAPHTFVLSVSRKPGIMLVWLGTVLITLGLALSWCYYGYRRGSTNTAAPTA